MAALNMAALVASGKKGTVIWEGNCLQHDFLLKLTLMQKFFHVWAFLNTKLKKYVKRSCFYAEKCPNMYFGFFDHFFFED